MAIVCDFSTLIERFKQHDSNNDGALNFEEYDHLLQDMGLRMSEEFSHVTYDGLYERSKPGITFNDVRALYESKLRGPRNKVYCLILFRGVDEDKDALINEKEFVLIAKYLIQDWEKIDVSETFTKCEPGSDGKVTYREVAKNLFGYKPGKNENPHNQPIVIQSPHSSCCNLL